MKYYAASVPRTMRAARLGHLRTDAVLGCWFFKSAGGSNQVFDVIMLPEAEFARAKNQLIAPAMGSVLQQQGQPTAPYILKDIKEIDVPEGDPNPAQTAAAHFRKAFNLQSA
jgi:hypothetical protein